VYIHRYYTTVSDVKDNITNVYIHRYYTTVSDVQDNITKKYSIFFF